PSPAAEGAGAGEGTRGSLRARSRASRACTSSGTVAAIGRGGGGSGGSTGRGLVSISSGPASLGPLSARDAAGGQAAGTGGSGLAAAGSSQPWASSLSRARVLAVKSARPARCTGSPNTVASPRERPHAGHDTTLLSSVAPQSGHLACGWPSTASHLSTHDAGRANPPVRLPTRF